MNFYSLFIIYLVNALQAAFKYSSGALLDLPFSCFTPNGYLNSQSPIIIIYTLLYKVYIFVLSCNLRSFK